MVVRSSNSLADSANLANTRLISHPASLSQSLQRRYAVLLRQGRGAISPSMSLKTTERYLIRPRQKVIGTKFASATRENTIAFQVQEYVLEKFSRYALRFSNVSDPHGMSSAGKCDDRAECISSPLRDHRSPGVSPAHLELDPVLSQIL